MQGYNHDFFEAVKKGNRLGVEEMLSAEPHLISARDAEGMSAVLTALYYQEPEIADLLIDRGASLNLFEAAAAGRMQEVLTILDEDARQVNAWSADGFQPLGLACFFGHTSLVQALLERGAEVSSSSRNPLNVQPLHSAVAGQHLEIARLLLEHGADSNARQGEGFTPLHGAAQNGQIEMVRLLLDHGADPTLRDEAGELPVDLAQTGGFGEVTDLLLNYSPRNSL